MSNDPKCDRCKKSASMLMYGVCGDCIHHLIQSEKAWQNGMGRVLDELHAADGGAMSAPYLRVRALRLKNERLKLSEAEVQCLLDSEKCPDCLHLKALHSVGCHAEGCPCEYTIV